jgi:hypothetical protein
MSTYHLFDIKPIPEGRKAVLETCVRCGIRSWRYSNNSRSYPVKRQCIGPTKDLALEYQLLSERIGRLETRLENMKTRLANLKCNKP